MLLLVEHDDSSAGAGLPIMAMLYGGACWAAFIASAMYIR
jgi:hypothetical protein